MMKLAPYPEYKDSGLPWLDKVPKGWRFFRGKNVFNPLDIRSETGTEELLSVSERQGVTPRKNVNVTMFQAASYQGYKLCWPGDLVINSLWAWMQGLGFSKYHGIISTAYGVYRPKIGRVSDFRYFDYLLRSTAYKWELRVRSKGIWRSRYQLKDDDFLAMPILVPGADEQAQIARFLDWKTAQINKFIRNKRRLIELLKEQKQNVINQAVTRGVDPNVKLKPSGVEWIGDIPEHWDPRKLLYASSLIVDGTHFSPENSETGDFLYITAKNIKECGVITENATYIKAEDHAPIYRRCPVMKGDILYIKDGATAGIACVNQLESEFSLLSSVALIKPKKSAIMAEYLAHQLNCQLLKTFVLRNLVGGAMTRFTIDLIKRFPVICPPINEQADIVKHIHEQIAPIDQAITRAQREIDLMCEYRTRLISDVVTGQVDVRGIGLPAEASAQAGAPEVAEEDLLALDEDSADSDNGKNEETDVDDEE